MFTRVSSVILWDFVTFTHIWPWLYKSSRYNKSENIYEATEIQTEKVLIDLDEIKLNHIIEHQKMKLPYASGLDEWEYIKSTALAEKSHMKHSQDLIFMVL